MVQLNQAIWSISTSIKSVQALAIQLKKGAYNVQLVSAIAFKQGTDELTGSNKAIYQAAIKVLYNTLKAGLLNCKTIKLNLDTLSNQLIGIETTMGSLSTSLTNTAEGKSKEFKNWRDDMRAKVYGGCTVSVLCGPHCIAICYSIGAGVLESEIAKYKRETESFVTEFNQFAASFSAMSTMAGQASLVSKKWYNKVQDFENVIQTQYDLIEGTQDVLYMNQEVR